MKPRVVNLVLVSISVVVMLVVLLFSINFLDYADPIPYKNWKEISLNDFKGFKRPFQTYLGTDRFAFIHTEIRLDRLPNGGWTVSTFFHPSRSYVYNPRIWYSGLLRHEIYHLHVTEIASRRLREKISKLELASENAVNKLLEDAYWEEWQMQTEYDTQSDHSVRLREQKQWEAKIDSILATLNKYSDQ